MTTSKTKLTYYNGILWRTVILSDGTRLVQPFRMVSGAPTTRAAVRRYRKPAQNRGVGGRHRTRVNFPAVLGPRPPWPQGRAPLHV